MTGDTVPADRPTIRWSRSMKALLGLAVVAVLIVVLAGGLFLCLSGPSPLTTQSVNVEPSAVTSEIDRSRKGTVSCESRERRPQPHRPCPV